MASVRSDGITELDEGLLYAAIGVALMAGVCAAGAGSGSLNVGLIGGGLVAAGSLVSWRVRTWGWRGALLGLLLGLLAGAMYLLYVQRESTWEASGLYHTQGEAGLVLAVRMAVIPIILSFVLVRYEIIAFSLVPTLSAFGLVGSQGRWPVITACFALFLPAALVAMGHGMLLSGIAATQAERGDRRRLGPWRARHWIALGTSIAVVAVLAYALYFPVAIYSSQYRWRILARVVARVPSGMPHVRAEIRDYTTFPVGRGSRRLSQTPVLSIQGAPSPLWRGQVFDLYAGRSWLRSEELIPERDIIVADRGIDISRAFPAPPSARPATHVVRAEADLPGFVFFSPGQIQRLTAAGSVGPARVYSDNLKVDTYGCVERSEGLMRRGFTYEVASIPLEARLQNAGAPTRPPDQLSPNYFAVPFGARRVADLARRVASAEPTPERKLAALETYLQQNCVYTLNVPAAPRGWDAVDYFVFRSKRGHCDLFASALAVMARAAGIPTRLATGYAYPSLPSGADQSHAAGADSQPALHILRECDAHAWVEAYLPNWGWVSADATPVQGDAPMPLFRRSVLTLRFFLQDQPIIAGGLAAILLVSLTLFTLRLRGMAIGFPWLRLQPTDARSSVVRTYAHLLRLLRRRGRRRSPAQTPLEFLAALASGDGPNIDHALPAITSLTELFLDVRYGPGPVTDETVGLAQQHLTEARQQLRRRAPRRAAS